MLLTGWGWEWGSGQPKKTKYATVLYVLKYIDLYTVLILYVTPVSVDSPVITVNMISVHPDLTANGFYS